MFLLSQVVKINRSGNAKTSCNNKIINLYLTRKRETLDARLRVSEREREICKFLSLFHKRCECWKLRNQNAWLKNGCTANQTRFYLHKEKNKDSVVLKFLFVNYDLGLRDPVKYFKFVDGKVVFLKMNFNFIFMGTRS